MQLNKIENSVLDGTTKGLPAGTAPLRLADIGSRKWSVLEGDLPLPLATIRASTLAANSDWMRGFLAHTGVRIAPHGKTSMCPQLYKIQLDDGAWAITVASVQQLRVCREYGVDRVLLANQLMGRGEIGYVLGELAAHAEFEFFCFVDSVANVEELASAARSANIGRPLQLLLDVGFPGGRTGCRTLDDALTVARAVSRQAPLLSLAGVAGFEGILSGATPDETEQKVRGFLGHITDVAVAVDSKGLFNGAGPIVLSAGGSGFFDVVADLFSRTKLNRATEVVIRSGCYLTHDGHMYRDLFAALEQRHPDLAGLGGGLKPALNVWARVQSRPEAQKAILSVGKRDISYDIHLPEAALWYRPGRDARPVAMPAGHTVTGLNDQHCHMALPADSPLAVGDLVAFDISHPCTTFDKWQLIHVVDDDWVVTDAMRTFF